MIPTSSITITNDTTNRTIQLHQHYEYTYTEDLITVTILTLASIWIVLGNMLVIVAFMREKKLRTTTNYCILSLCIADFVIGIFVVNFYTVFVAEKGWHFGATGCTIWLMVDYGVYQASVFGVLLITVDRFLVIKYPFIKQMRIRTSGRIKIVIFFAWLSAFSLWVPAIVHHKEEVADIATTHHQCHLPFDGEKGGRMLIVATAVVSYIIPVFVIVYVAMYTCFLLWKSKRLKQRVLKGEGHKELNRKISRSTTTSSQQASLIYKDSDFARSSHKRGFSVIEEMIPSPVLTPRLPKKERSFSTISSFQQVSRKLSRATSMLSSSSENEKIMNSPNLSVKKRVVEIQRISRFVVLMAVAFTVTILPFGVFSVMRICSGVEDRWWRMATILAYLNSALNPLCYAFGNKNFNIAMRKLVLRRR